MKSHELARQLLAMEDVDVWIPKINEQLSLSVINEIKPVSGLDAPEGRVSKSFEDLVEFKAIVIQ